MNRMPRTNNKQRYMANASLKYDITDWLNVTGRVRIDNSSIDYEEKRYASTNTLFASTTGLINSIRQMTVRYMPILSQISLRLGKVLL